MFRNQHAIEQLLQDLRVGRAQRDVHAHCPKLIGVATRAGGANR